MESAGVVRRRGDMKPVEANPSHVLKRMMELRDWAEYIEQSVTRDQPFETGKFKILMELADPRLLREVQDRARILQISISRVIEALKKSTVPS
jgi:hypothetical protein